MLILCLINVEGVALVQKTRKSRISDLSHSFYAFSDYPPASCKSSSASLKHLCSYCSIGYLSSDHFLSFPYQSNINLRYDDILPENEESHLNIPLCSLNLSIATWQRSGPYYICFHQEVFKLLILCTIV